MYVLNSQMCVEAPLQLSEAINNKEACNVLFLGLSEISREKEFLLM